MRFFAWGVTVCRSKEYPGAACHTGPQWRRVVPSSHTPPKDPVGFPPNHSGSSGRRSAGDLRKKSGCWATCCRAQDTDHGAVPRKIRGGRIRAAPAPWPWEHASGRPENQSRAHLISGYNVRGRLAVAWPYISNREEEPVLRCVDPEKQRPLRNRNCLTFPKLGGPKGQITPRIPPREEKILPAAA